MASSSGSRRTPASAAPQPPAATPPRVGEQIQRLRNERKLTLDDLSRAAGVSKSMLSEIERDKANPTIAVAWRLTNALGITLDELFSQPKASETIRVDGPHDIPTLAGHDGRYQLRVWPDRPRRQVRVVRADAAGRRCTDIERPRFPARASTSPCCRARWKSKPRQPAGA